jgi:hypothetical protein
LNNNDRKRIERVYQLAVAIPFPQFGSGMATASIGGAMTYASDMNEFMPALQSLCLALLSEGREGLSEGDDYQPPDQLLTALEAWIELRRKADWERPVPYFQDLYKQLFPAKEGA